MKESLEATLKDVELTKEVYHLYTLEHLTQQEISVKLYIGRSTVWRKIRTFEAENPELAEKMSKQGSSGVVAQLVQMRITVCVSSAFSVKPSLTSRSRRSMVG